MSYTTEECTIMENKPVIEDIFEMIIHSPEMAKKATPGQFVNLYTHSKEHLLPRPISICDIDDDKETIRFLYRAVGTGTKEFSGYKSDDTVIKCVGPLGNGYFERLDIENALQKKYLLMGGGIGIPPMLLLARRLSEAGVSKDDIQVVLGFRDETFLVEDFEKYGNVTISSDSGKNGIKGNALDAVKQCGIEADVICACGPKPMLRAIKEYAVEKNIPAYVSLEERMACGIGACLACVCESTEVDDHSKVNNKRVCKDGPVFEAGEIVI